MAVIIRDFEVQVNPQTQPSEPQQQPQQQPVIRLRPSEVERIQCWLAARRARLHAN